MIIEHGTFNTQSSIGAGISGVTGAEWNTYNGYRPMRKTGDTIQAGNKSWDMNTLAQKQRINAQVYQIQSLSYRGIENPYGHIFKWVDGFNFINNIPAEGDPYYTGYAIKAAIDGGTVDYAKFVSHANHAAAQADDNYRELLGLDGDTLKIMNVSRYWKQNSPNLMPADDKQSDASYGGDYFYAGTPGDNASRAFAVGGGAYCGGGRWGRSAWPRFSVRVMRLQLLRRSALQNWVSIIMSKERIIGQAFAVSGNANNGVNDGAQIIFNGKYYTF
jgi:hypothetical protein